MFDKYLICEETLRNRHEGNATTGFEFDVRLAYYRGLGLSMVEDLVVTVDGEAVSREAIRFELRGKSYSLDELETEYEAVWEMGERAKLFVRKPGGLSTGEHTVTLTEQLRIAYLPFPLMGNDRKVVTL